MKKILVACFLALTAQAVLCLPGFGAGFALYDFGARGNALGGAMTGKADDPSALAFNPAGITQISGEAFMTGIGFLMPSATVFETSTGSAVDQKDHTFVLPQMYYTRQMGDRLWLGMAVMARFGLGTDFPEDWFGRYSSYRAMLKSVSVNPSLAWKVSDRFSVALGVEALWLEFDSRKKVPTPYGDIDLRLLGDDIGYGWNLGLHFRPDEATRIGLHYRSEVDLTVSGNVDACASTLGSDSTGASAGLTLPEMYMFGISRQVTPKLNVEAGALYTRWSSYDSLVINFDKSLYGFLPAEVPSEKNWNDVWRYQLGIEYRQSPEWTWRVGYTYDQSPIPDARVDYMAPLNDRQLYSIGFGYTRGNGTWDFAYTYLVADERRIAARPLEGIVDSGTRDLDTHIFMLSYTIRF
ncbi:MAG: OmpP1/FadL family transporter [Thermovirgaceae bacterium]